MSKDPSKPLHFNVPVYSELIDALHKLANEAAGFLALSDVDRHGNTNTRILRERIEQARDMIKRAKEFMHETAGK